MKKTLFITLVFIAFVSCKQNPKIENYKATELNVTTSIYPESIAKVFDAHGGIDTWNAMEGMYYEIEKPNTNDTYDIALKSRKSLITSEHHLLGFDGEYVWLKNLDTVAYKSNPKFFYNLMFYFYAMPFVLGDDGINYAEVEPIEFEGVSYPGLLISYESGVGESPDDEYILYYHPETYKMEWLAYTVTYFSKEKAKKFSLIRYTNWEDVNGLVLPTVLQWHHYENGNIGDVRNEVKFVNAKLMEDLPNEDMFEVPDSTMIVK
ncbi:DUF6503 family protein [Pontimicrobium aquaticum]|uniref:Threonine synthase n=1 Tax=Pontimicrobium aquaticum TaxID=2565367 RepID=A0A4U0EWI5_9FLAO|nr:DUF6503 family protein [Pontimicrobium aquaticum]TJY36285.1 hypothetical protein E5167_06355 [Pontimicrobium aquaticum]